MFGLCATKSLVFGSASRFVADEVRISPAQAGGPYRLVCVHHDVMLGCFGNCKEIMVHHPLAVVVFTAGKDITHISGFYRVISILVHQLVRFLHMALIVSDRRRAFVVHNQFDALGVRIFIQSLNVEIRIRGLEVKHGIFGIAGPIFPANIPTLHQQSIKTVCRCKVNVPSHIGIIGAMTAIRLCRCIISDA